MKRPPLRSLILAAALVLFAGGAHAQVTLTLGQSSVSNTFAGSVSVAVSNLLNGETVIIEKFKDANQDGTLDAGDLLQTYFAVTDGVFTSIGGVRNENVPYDEDLTVNGSVRESFDFSALADFHHFIGGYLVRVSSPTARFAPVTQPFTVTQTVYNQTISGFVTNGAFAAVALLFDSEDGDLVAGTYADAAGNYTIKALPGSYQVISVKPGFVAGQPGSVTLNTNSSTNVNLVIFPGGPTLSGKISDASSGAGLPAVQLFFDETNGAFSLAFTDTNGNYSAAVTPGSWNVHVESDGLNALGYVKTFSMQTNYNTVTGSVANINRSYSKANALVYGLLRDAQSNGIPRVEIRASNSSGESSARTATNGYFAFGVIASTNLSIFPEETDLAALGFFGISTNVSAATNQAVQVNLSVRPVTAYLRGRVFDNQNEPISNISLVVQISPVSQSSFSFYPRTDSSGFFNVGLYGTNWNIALECVEAGNRNLVSFSKDFVVVDGVDQNNISLTAFYSTQTISAQVRQTNNSPITNLRVFAGATINGTNYVTPCASTDGSGNALLKVLSGAWNVSLDNFGLNSMGFASATNQLVNIAGANGNALFVQPRFTEVRPTFGAPTINTGNFSTTVFGASGGFYQVESSINLTNWVSVWTQTAFGGSFNFSTPMGADPRRYFRVTLVQGGGEQ